MKKNMKKTGIIVGCIVAILGISIVIMLQGMNQKTKDALEKQVNLDINMEKVKDGTYSGCSDGGMVYVEVEVMVKDHSIESINLIRHDNGKGKAAEAMIVEMIAKNTDNVDAVSGATASSKTIRNAVNNALQKGMDETK